MIGKCTATDRYDKNIYMKYLILVIYLLVVASNADAQYRPYVDLVPFVTECDVEQTLELAVECSENRLRGYYLSNVDTTVCPPTDTSAHVRIAMEVDDTGQYTVQLSSAKLRPTCLQYFEQKAAEMRNHVEMFPAELDGNAVNYRKALSFHYPALGDSTLTPDSTGAYKMIEQMPRFYNKQCEEMLGGPIDKENCAKVKMLEFIYKNLKYPKKARENDIEGMVVVRFVVDKQGYTKDVEIIREIGGNCGMASLLIVNQMNHQRHAPFIAGMVDGRPVKVQYTLPVKFKLQSNRKQKRR